MRLARHFLAIWHRALTLPSLQELTPELVTSWANARGLNIENAREIDIGAFHGIPSIVLTIDGSHACLPKIPAADDPQCEERKAEANRIASLWEKMEWFGPSWIPNDRMQQLLKAVVHSSNERAIELFNYHTSTIYTMPFQAICIEQILPKANSLLEFTKLAREAFLAFYSGYRASSIAALIPAIEGSITKIASELQATLPIGDRIEEISRRAIARAARMHFEGMWVPREYLSAEFLFGEDERVFIFSTFSRWLKTSFFCNTDEYRGSTWLNRHLFAHATSTSWQQSANFGRLIVVLATVGLLESWLDESNNVSFSFPAINEEGTLLWEQAVFRAQMQTTLKEAEEKHFHQHGRLVFEMPTEDGAMLRRAILSRDCIDDLVRPLRNSGWSVEMGEPDDSALYVRVIARSGAESLRITLLYSCATANELYQELSNTSDAILYRGAPYRQEQYAYNLEIHVGPVAGWKPPLAPS